jgi:hypothetical protein
MIRSGIYEFRDEYGSVAYRDNGENFLQFRTLLEERALLKGRDDFISGLLRSIRLDQILEIR